MHSLLGETVVSVEAILVGNVEELGDGVLVVLWRPIALVLVAWLVVVTGNVTLYGAQ